MLLKATIDKMNCSAVDRSLAVKDVRIRHFYPLTDGVKENALTDGP